jgi:hypothetical protein
MKDLSPALLAKLQANGREYAAKHGIPWDLNESPRKAWERNTGITPESGFGRADRELISEYLAGKK